MAHFLLTNDDGVDSPALVPFARALGEHATVSVVVPARERSWVGKAISRLEEIVVDRTVRDGLRITTCSGYPADAAQLGIHALADAPPDLVVSGINTGFNHGTAFVLSSGTVGAAVEGWISGVPAIAFSTGASDSDYHAWQRHIHTPAAADQWRTLAATCTAILRDVRRAGLLAVADVVNVNLPFDATPDTPRRLTRVARVRYAQLFRAVATDRYRHEFAGLLATDDAHDTDVAAGRDGVVSITPLRMPEAADVPDALRRAVEDGRAP